MSMRDKWGLFSTETDPGFKDRLKLVFNGERVSVRENSIQDAAGMLKGPDEKNLAVVVFNKKDQAFVSDGLIALLEGYRKTAITKGKPLLLEVSVTLRGGVQTTIKIGFKPNLTKAERMVPVKTAH